MKRKFSYSIGEMNRRLLAIGKSIRGYLVISTLSSIIGALAHMGLIGLWCIVASCRRRLLRQLCPVWNTDRWLCDFDCSESLFGGRIFSYGRIWHSCQDASAAI
mgnify:CR=1 FL=1